MDKLKILIVEDEMIIAESISDMLEELGYEVLGICIRAKQALDFIKNNPPDLALFDIRLKGEEDGIWLGRQLDESYKFPFIFLTSYGDKATIDQAVSVSPYGYLLKPIDKQNLYSTIEVALRKFGDFTREDDNEGKVLKDSFFVKQNHQNIKVQIEDIIYIKSDNNYLEIYTKERRHIIRSSLRDFISQLSSKKFLQIHRSYIVNMEKIDSFSSTTLLVDKKELPVSKQYKQIISEHFKTM